MNMVTYFHSSIADYYLGIWGGGNPKPFKYTEIQRHRFNLLNREGSADRKVPVQPLVFNSKEGTATRYNLRKVSITCNIMFISLKYIFLVWRITISPCTISSFSRFVQECII